VSGIGVRFNNNKSLKIPNV